MKKQRKHYAPEDKVAILRRHLLDKEPISSCVMKWDSSRRSSTAGKRSFRERGCCLRAEITAEPFRRSGADRIPGE
jgi:hypothetical protein